MSWLILASLIRYMTISFSQWSRISENPKSDTVDNIVYFLLFAFALFGLLGYTVTMFSPK